MAAAEARAVWQRTANRCFVQEDAKRAPKLAACQSSSAQSKQGDGAPTSVADTLDDHTGGCEPLHRNSSYSLQHPDMRWWLQLQPGYGCHKVFAYDTMNVTEAAVKNFRDHHIVKSTISKFDSEDDRNGLFVDKYSSTAPDVKAVHDKNSLEFFDFEETIETSKSTEMNFAACLIPQMRKECNLDPELPWMESEKNMPWWRTTDKEDLASLVSKRSHDYIGNCDLPPPQKMHRRRYQHGRPRSSNCNDTSFSSLDSKGQTGCISSPVVHTPCSSNCGSSDGRAGLSTDGHMLSGSDKPFRYSGTTTQKDAVETGQVSDGDSFKAQLLEALRHSQTRAREAEKVAQQICAEKEHVIKLFLKQASQLFAYKQWFQLLELETLYYQMKNRDPPMSTFFPVVIPWLPQKGRKLSNRNERGRPRHDSTGTNAIAFAMGFSLVGAGLLLGWTVGWMWF